MWSTMIVPWVLVPILHSKPICSQFVTLVWCDLGMVLVLITYVECVSLLLIMLLRTSFRILHDLNTFMIWMPIFEFVYTRKSISWSLLGRHIFSLTWLLDKKKGQNDHQNDLYSLPQHPHPCWWGKASSAHSLYSSQNSVGIPSLFRTLIHLYMNSTFWSPSSPYL